MIKFNLQLMLHNQIGLEDLNKQGKTKNLKMKEKTLFINKIEN